MVFGPQVMETFVLEAKELLAKMEESLLKLEQGEQNPDLINDIFRSAHTLKGTAGMFSFTELSNFAHELETLLATFRENKTIPSKSKITVLLESIDCLTNLVYASVKGSTLPNLLTAKQAIVEKLKANDNDAALAPPVVLSTTQGIAPKTPESIPTLEPTLTSNIVSTSIPAATPVPTLTSASIPAATPVPTLTSASIPAATPVPTLTSESIPAATPVPTLTPASIPAVTPVPTLTPASIPAVSSATVITNFIKIDSTKLDEIINLIGETVIVQEYINSLITNQIKPELSAAIERIAKLINNLRTLSLQLRMQPIKEIFSKFTRVVRDIATQQNKQIKLQTYGENTELDKVIMEKISDPLLHLIRNACDHGIDLVEERLALGKPACGVITLQASQENGEVLIKVSDDGKGMDLDRIKQKAISVGMLNKDAEPSEQQILSCIFAPGFSTSEQITDISGRGVGMDVVKKEIEKLHGSININTKKAQGTIISIRLPLTLAIVDGVLMKIAEFYCVIPMWNIIECVALTNEEYKSITLDGYLNFRNTILPVVILTEFWQIAKTSNLPSTIIIIQHSEHKIGILVNQLIGTVQTVIKSMPEIFSFLRWVNGAAILGDGTIAIILDIPGLIFDVIEKDLSKSKKVLAT